MNYKTAFGSYLKAEDLQGKTVRLSIERVTLEDIKGQDGQTQRRLVVHFAGRDKTMILNKTNADTLGSIFGEDTDDWTGAVILYPDTTMFGGKRVACLRLRANTAPKKVAPVVVEPEDETFSDLDAHADDDDPIAF